MSELISIDSVVKKTEDGKDILKGISAKVMAGELITIIGPSGSGKSTFLSLLNRMADPDDGTIFLKGKPFNELDVLKLRKHVGMVFQHATMIKGAVNENIRLGPCLHKQAITEQEIDQLLDWVDLTPSIKEQDASSLSGGQKQKIALARTLAINPEVLLLDEVTASLDTQSTLEIEHLIKNLHTEWGKTILWVTHNIAQARRMGQYTWVIADGELIESGHTKEVFEQPKHEITRNFIESLDSKEGISE